MRMLRKKSLMLRIRSTWRLGSSHKSNDFLLFRRRDRWVRQEHPERLFPNNPPPRQVEP
jgi:hypothetical protein